MQSIKNNNMSSKMYFFYFVTLMGLFFNSCSSTHSDNRTSVSSVTRIPASLIQTLKANASALPNIYSFLVLKDNELAIEEYYNGADAQSLLHIRSITKSVSSILVGISLEKGQLSNLDEKVVDYFPDYIENAEGELINEVTLAHIIDMQSGFDWNESVEAIAWYTTISDTWDYFFQKEVSVNPGTQYNYNSGAVSLLTRFIENNQNLPYDEYAQTYLFEPLGIEQFEWEKDGLGNTRADAGLQLRAIDMTKIGDLMMDSGMFENEQLLPEEWVNDSWSFEINLNSNYGPIENLHYNNLWWMGEYKGDNVFFALGYGGQLLLCVPEHDLIVVTNHEFRLPGNVVANHSRDFLENVFKPLLNGI
jgi:CubicO group peptidase (beta-lactamase class C family)